MFYRGDGGDFLFWKDSLSATALQWGGGERERMEKHFHLPARGKCFICFTGKKCYYPVGL